MKGGAVNQIPSSAAIGRDRSRQRSYHGSPILLI
jgi:hypothetical protein